MFDQQTVQLISEAPALDGVDLLQLPQEFTRIYAEIVATRIRMRDGPIGPASQTKVREIADRMSSLAFTQELFVSVSADRVNRTAAAFVAGSAHHLVMMAEQLHGQPKQASRLTFNGVSPEVSASLLFLIAEANADAAEVAKSIVTDGSDGAEAALLRSIQHLVRGQLPEILSSELPVPRIEGGSMEVDSGLQALQYLLFCGVRALAAALLGKSPILEPAHADPAQIFRQAIALCVSEFSIGKHEDRRDVASVYPGPLHLASLLLSVSGDLQASALINVKPPGGIDETRWHIAMQTLAVKRPYLWRNHLEAIASGYLESGNSAAISFPTGSGKSTLSELKIATALMQSGKVLFLVPTLALVDQTAKALAESFPDAEVLRERDEEAVLGADSDELPAISVMTPERCLAILGFDSSLLGDTKLIILDECHLLHPREDGKSRRAVDAMLCILNLTSIAPAADLLLLSAMMSNSGELAGWIESLTNRRCLSLSVTWKPTRQVRGCVVYRQEETLQLDAKLRSVRLTSKNRHPPAATKRSLNASPLGFFCLRQTWQSKAIQDYALIPVIDKQVLLSTGTAGNGEWYLTPNGNQVAAQVAAASARKGIKTLVFSQTIPLANSASREVSKELGDTQIELLGGEQELYAIALDEIGAAEALYVQVDAEGRMVSACAPHHGLLLPEERLLHESLFRRPGGLNALVATSTLAQGMNLPSEVVIIAGDSRFDPSANKLEQLDAHEILNAAGRAGRAGESAHGFVIVVPSKVVHFDEAQNKIHNHWADLRAIFSQSDQCLIIEDPLRSVLDQIHVAAGPLPDLAVYFLRRLPVDPIEGESVDVGVRALLNRSLGAYQARVRNEENWFEQRMMAVSVARKAELAKTQRLSWADRVASTTAVPVEIVQAIGSILAGPFDFAASVTTWCKWFRTWFTSNPGVVPKLVRQESLESLFGTPYKLLSDDLSRGQYVVPNLLSLLDAWMSGLTLLEMESLVEADAEPSAKCTNAREFVVKVVPELAYVFGVPAQIFRAMNLDKDVEIEVPVGLAVLGVCVRTGVDSAEKAALRQLLARRTPRRVIHREMISLSPFLQASVLETSFTDTVRRVRDGMAVARVLTED